MATPFETEIIGALAAQFGAAIETLRRVIVECPDESWDDVPGFQSFFYTSYHTVFWLDFYLAADPAGYRPPEPFTLSELDPEGAPPPRRYSREEVLAFLSHARARFEATVPTMTPERALERHVSGWMDFSIFELHLYNMRHVQHHAAQLNLVLRQRHDRATRWVSGRRVPGGAGH